MRKPVQDQGKRWPSGVELSCLGTLFQKTGFASNKPLPGQRLPAVPLPSIAPHLSILRWPDQYSPPHTGAPRHVKFKLPSANSSVIDSISSLGSNTSDEGYIGIDAQCPQAGTQNGAYAMEYQVQHIPLECLCELFRTGALDRVLALSTRDIGRLAINHFPPFRSLHSYGTVMHHLYKQQDMDFDTAADMCESTIAVNNTILSTTDPARKHDLSKLMLFLNTDVELEGRMMMQWTDDRTLTHDLWRDVFQSNMYCAMVSGQIIAHVKDDTVHECLQRLVDERCIIRPVFLYMFRQYIDDQETEVLMRNAQEQFHIYNMAIQIMQWNYQDKQDISMWYTQYTILFVIAEINDMIAQSVFKQDETAQLCSTVLAADINDNASEPGSPKDICYGDPLSSHELLCLLDWDFAAVIGFRLAHEFYEENQSSTAMLAKLNTKVHGVDTSNGQPFPLVEPVLDADFHQFVHRRVSAVYGKWQYGFSYMVLEEAIEAYNVIILDIRNRS